MKLLHTPAIDARYWTAITLASVFGTNLGDLYAHTSGLGILAGLAVLVVLAGIVFLVERMESMPHQVYYWLVIIIIRTGATNIADYLAFRIRIPAVELTLCLAMLIAFFGWRTMTASKARGTGPGGLPNTDYNYWLAMLGAGVFGTVLGDVCSHVVGQGMASLGLGVLLGFALLAWGQRRAAGAIALYWLTVAVARTAGTAMGDWLAENKILDIGLAASTVLSGAVFVAVLVLWPRKNSASA